MSSHHRNHHRSSSMAASTTAATNSGHNNNYASNPTNGSTRYMNHPNLSTASIHVSNPSTTNNAARIRQLWQAFERACANGRSNMEHAFATAKSRSGVEQAQTIRTSYFEKIRMEWQSRLQGAGLQPEQWTDMTEDEMSNVARVLGDDEDGSDGEDSDDSVEEADEDVRERRSGYSSAHAPSMMSSSTRSGNISTSTASSYALVNPSVLNSEEEDDFFFNSASVMVTSHDLTSDDDDGYMSHSHHSHASHTQYSAAKAPSTHLGQWNHNASTESLDSSHSNHNAGYFSATSSTSASRPAPLTSTASYNQQSYQQQPNTPRSNVFPSSSNTSSAVPQRPKLTSQYSSASTYAGNASAGTASKAPSGSTVPVVAPKPRQAYIGPHLFDDTELEPGSAEVKNASGADGSSAELSADEEADFEAFKMRTRMLKIVEFHQAAALAEIKLAVAIYGERRKALLASAAVPQTSSASLLVNGKNAKGKVNGKEKENVDQDSSRRTERISISARLAEHERRMVELQKEKEEERKEMVKEERRRRREELESKKQAAAAANGMNGLKATTTFGTGKGRGRSGTATATTPAMRRGSVSAVSGTSNAAPPITSNAPNTVTNPRSRPGRSGTLIGAINSRPSQAPAPSAPTPAPMLAPKASAPVHPAWLDDFGSGGNAEEEEGEGGWDEEEAKGRLEEPFDLEKILSGEDSVEKLLANMLGSNAGATAGASNAANGNAKGSPSLAAANTTAFHPSQTVHQYFPPSQTQPQPLAGISSASSSAASSLYHGSSGGKRRMSDAASIASGMSGMSGASGMMHGMMGSGVANAKRKAHAPKMQKKPSLFGDDSDSDDEDEDGSSEEEEAESNSPSPRGHDLASADAMLTSELMQDPVIAAQIAQYLPGGGGGGGASSAFGGIGDRRGFLPEAAASAFGYESWGVPSQTKPSKLMAPSSSSNPSQASLWSNPAAAHSTTNLTSTLHAPVATPPTLASALLGSSSNQMKAGRATPMPTASTPAPSGWKKLGSAAAAGKAPGVRPPSQLSRPQSQAQGHVPTPAGGLVHAPQIPGLAPHQAQAFLESQKQMQAAQFGFGAGINMNDPYALAAAALESTLTGTSNPFGGATMGGSGYVSSSGDGYLGVGKKAKKASPFGSDDDEEGNVQGAVAAWAAGMGAGANSNARGKIGMAGSMMMGLSNPFSQQSHASAGMNSTKGKGKMGMSGWGLPVQQQQQQGGGAMEDGWGMEYVNGDEEQDEEAEEQEGEEDVWGAPSKTVASAWSTKIQAAQSGKSAVNGKKVASPSIVNMSAAANAKALKEKLEKEKAEKERLEKEKEKEEKEQAAAAAAAQPPVSAMSKKQTKKQKQAAKKGGGAAAASQPEPEPEQKEPTPPPSPPSPPAPEPSAISLMSRILPGKGRGRKDSVSVISSSSPSISGAANASGGGIFGGWDDKESSLNGGSSFSAMSAATPRQASKIPGSIFEQQPQADEFGAGFGTPKQGNLFKSSAASAWGSAMNTNSTIRASNANSGASAKGSLRSLFGGGGQSSFSIPGAFDDGNDQDDGGGGGDGVENGEKETKEDEWDSWSAPTKKGAAATPPAPPTKAAPGPAPSPPASSPTVATNTGGGGKKGKGKKGGKGANNNNTSPAIANANAKGPTTNNKLPKPAIEVVPDEDDNQVKGGTLPSDSKHIMEDANPDADVAIDLVNVLGEERAAALMREARENEAKLGGISTPSPAPAPAAKGNANGNGKSAWGAKSEGATGKGGVPTPAVNSTPVWGQAVRRGGKAGGKLF
ncbi:hypothetical protein CPC08DRAFT_248475 [Agrocybe pediades]|nr:hypothetical protein CPC08DRAFT_248475 [Agrocybe pediades]